MTQVLRPDHELVILDQELARLDARRGQLLLRRSYLVSLLAGAGPSVGPASGWGSGWVAPGGGGGARRPETSPPGVRHVLLTLGGVLLAIAAVAFTLVGWGQMGIAGRSVVLGAVTVLALSVPALLVRRGRGATAEAVAALALVLTVLDAYGLYATALSGTPPLGYVAGAAAVLAALWAGYGRVVGGLRVPLPAAVVAAQLPLPLGVSAAGAPVSATAWALFATAALDVAVVVWAKSAPVRGFAAAGAGVAGALALLTGCELSLTAGSPVAAAGPGVLLLAGAALGLFAALRLPGGAVGCAGVSGLAVIAAVGGVLRPGVPDSWAVPAYVLGAVALAAVTVLVPGVRGRLPRPAVRGLVGVAGGVGACSVVWALPLVALALGGGVRQLAGVWAGAPGGARAAAGADFPWSGLTAAPPVLLMVAGALGVAYGRTRGAATAGAPGADADATTGTAAGPATGADRVRAALLSGVVALVWAALLVLPLTLDLGFGAALVVPLVLTALALALVVLAGRIGAPPHGPVTVTALCCALAAGAGAALLSLATRPATVTVLATLTLLHAGTAVAMEYVRRPEAAPEAALAPLRVLVQAVLGCGAVVYAAGLAVAAGAAAGWSAEGVAVLVLVVPALVALLGARLRRHPVAAPVELAGAGAGALAVVLALGRAPVLALVLALCGVIAAGTAVRAERRAVAGYAATGLFVLASWVRLAASGVGAPEAYTLPVTVPALAVGLLRRRRDPEASSWTAYGPGLAATLVPSLVAVWGDPHWARPLLLGLAALAVTLAGARLRLQAPLVLGGAVLALVGLHELAPYVVQVVGALPRWLPPALAGLLLLAVGATYEHRLRDARRLRDGLNRLR
ncbi:SCO7613 C-terminal domain-containing membrane protein [Streptomyces sp. NPDC088261]|uniref:SCO7613 C-terminal domain-containing membrane protein n=1 Tax=Streptomyces sp. NPDC088261 TaxID=3365851 RepID=UPI003810CF3B